MPDLYLFYAKENFFISKGKRRPFLLLFPLYSSTNFALVSPGSEVKPVILFDGQGKMTNLIHLAQGERPVVLSIFTLAWAPCKLEISALHEYALKKPEVSFFLVNIDSGTEGKRAKNEILLRKYTLPVFYDPGKFIIRKFFRSEVTPSMLVLFQGKVVYAGSGYTAETIPLLTENLRKTGF